MMQKWNRLISWHLLICCAFVGMGLVVVRTSVGQEKAAEARMRQDLEYLASKECEGRGVETEGLEKAANYIAKQFEMAGLKPGNGKSYFQPFQISSPGKLRPGSRVVLQGPQGQTIELTEGKHFQIMGMSAGGKVTAPLVFAGHGITAPNIKYDDYKNIEAAGKAVIVIRKTPRWDHKFLSFDGDRKHQHATFQSKFSNAELNKAAAVLLVNDWQEGETGDEFVPFRDLTRGTSSDIPIVQIKRDVVDQILRNSLLTGLRDMEKAIDRDLEPRSTALEGWKVTVDARVERQKIDVKNVVGVLPGSGSLAKEFVVVGAHYDHLGYGERGSLARNPGDRKKIHFGADDNASGTTVIMELARRFANRKDRPGRTLVFMAFSAEEKGLLGSRHYCNKEPLFPLKDTVAMVNLDMVGRMQTNSKSKIGMLRIQGVGTAKDFEKLIDKLNEDYDFALLKSKGGNGPSDHDSFYRQEIPVFFFWTGVHKDYHRPSDTADRINFEDMVRISNFAEDVVSHLVSRSEPPQYVRVASDTPKVGPGNIPKLGIMPAYDDTKKGLLIDGVSTKGPASKGGLKKGDLIVEINGRPVTNIGTYMAAMRLQKRGKAIPITVLRDKKKLTLKVAPY